MARRLSRFPPALTAAPSERTPPAFGDGQAPLFAWESRVSSRAVREQAGALAAAGILALAVMLRPAPRSLRRRASGRRGAHRLRERSRLVTTPVAGAVLALLLWALPWLSLHDTHHALERGEPACHVAQIVHSQGAGILPSTVALTQSLLANLVPPSEPPALPSRSAPRPAARSPPA